VTAPGLVILIPVYNDWVPCASVLAALDEIFATRDERPSVLLVDDGSIEPWSPVTHLSVPHLGSVSVLHLRRNIGHQRAICVGLSYLADQASDDSVLVMDGDGEDDPRDVARLVDASRAAGARSVVFAERTRRSETLTFRLFYALYRWVHRLLTGHRVRVGNFSIVPRPVLRALVAVPELWSHYAAAVFVSRQPYTMIPTQRARRLSGRSSMNMVSLVTHGLSAVAVFSDVVGTRLLIASLSLAGLMGLGIVLVVGIRLLTDLAIPGWATYAAGLLAVMLLQAILFAAMSSFVALGARRAATVLPIRDYALYVDRCERVIG